MKKIKRIIGTLILTGICLPVGYIAVCDIGPEYCNLVGAFLGVLALAIFAGTMVGIAALVIWLFY